MNFEIAKGIDEELYMLAERKKRLDRRIEQRESTLVDFMSAHVKSKERLHDKIKQQNIAARERNRKFFEEVTYVTGSLQEQRSRHFGKSGNRTETKASRELEQARLNYLKFSEKLLPSFREQKAMQQLGALHQMKLEKEQTEVRRQTALREMEKQHQLQCAVEQERRQLVLALALEERDKLAAAAEKRILQAQGRAVDQVIQEEFDTFGDEYAQHVNRASLTGMQQAQPTVEKHFASNRLHPSEPHPLPVPRNITSSAAESLIAMNAREQQRQQPKYIMQNFVDDEENKFNFVRLPPQEKHSGSLLKEQQSIPQPDHVPLATRSQHYSTVRSPNHQTKQRDLQLHDAHGTELLVDDLGVQQGVPNPNMSIEASGNINSDVEKPATDFQNDSISRLLSETVADEIVQSSGRLSNADDNVDNSELNLSRENRRKPSAVLPPKPPPIRNHSLVLLTDDESEDEAVIIVGDDAIDSKPQVEKELSPAQKMTDPTPLKDVKPDICVSDEFVQSHNRNDKKKESEGQQNDDIKSDVVDTTIPMNGVDSTTGNDTKNDAKSLESDLFSLTPAMSLKVTPQKPKGDILEDSNDSVSTLLQSPQSPYMYLTQLTKDCTPSQVLHLLQRITSKIETFTEPLAVRKGYGVATSAEASKARSASVSSGVGLDRQKRLMNAILADRDHEIETFQVEVVCALLLRVLSENGGYILPSEEINGLISVDKITKIHKRLGGGRSDMWNAIVHHMTEMTALKRMPVEEFAKIITTAFISHIDENERSRFERKILKTLQLAIMPKDKEGQSPAGTPLKLTAQTTPNNKPTFSTDLAPTPPMSPSASLDDSSSKIGNIFSTGGGGQFVNDKKFMSQRAAEKDKNKSTPSKLNSGIAIGSSGNSVLNRIQKLSNFDDDEIEDDEIIAQPPAMRDLSEDQSGSKGDLNASDEFDF